MTSVIVLMALAIAEWQTAVPEEVGLDSAALVQMLDAAAERKIPVHSVQIVRYGRLALDAYFYPYSADTRHDVASVTKSITSTLVGLAIDRRHVTGVTQAVVSLFPDRVVANLEDRKRRLNLEHVLTMQAGWDCGFEPNEARLMEMRRSGDWIQFMLDLPMLAEPGSRWAYCSGNCHLLSAILTQATGTNGLAFARRELFDPLGIRDVTWPADANGHNHGWGDLQMHPRDMARLGQLFLQQGRWNNRQIIPKEWISLATRPHVQRTSNNDHYGYFWWVKDKDFPTMYEAVGRGGQRMNIWPAKQLVIVFTGGGFEPGDLAKFILQALKSDQLLPENPKAARQLRERIGDARQPPPALPLSKLPTLAHRISGTTFKLSSNTLGLEALSLKFTDSAEAKADLMLQQERLQFPIGLDGVLRFATNAITTLPQGAKGQWVKDDTFVLELDLIGGINHYTFNMKFSDEGQSVTIRLNERTGLNNEQFNGVLVP